jgi:hypothetical protein
LDNISILNFFQCYNTCICSRWSERNLISNIYPWITLHIITFQPENYYRGYRRGNQNEQHKETGTFLTLSFAFCGYFCSCIYVTISLYSSSSIIQYRLLPMNQIFNIFKLTWLYWFHNGFEDYSICHLNWQFSGYNILSIYMYIYLPINFIYEIFSGWVRWFINQCRKYYYIP